MGVIASVSIIIMQKYMMLSWFPTLINHESVGLHWRGRVIECVSILCRFTLQLTLIGQGSSATITEKSKNNNYYCDIRNKFYSLTDHV